MGKGLSPARTGDFGSPAAKMAAFPVRVERTGRGLTFAEYFLATFFVFSIKIIIDFRVLLMG